MIASTAIALALLASAGPVLAEPAAREASHPGSATSSAGGEALRAATEALDRFRDHGVALEEGYVHGRENEDSFMMGEHWVKWALIGASRCELTEPTHLQYLRIDGRRTLIGTGYMCFADALGPSPPDWFGADVRWHAHGPEFCHRGKGEPWVDAFPALWNKYARTLPSPWRPVSWEALCRQRGGDPHEREVYMLHTWNWIPHPYGPFVHENPAVAFLRPGLTVPSRAALDSESARAALAALRLAYRGFPFYAASFVVVKASRAERRESQAIVRAAVGVGREAVDAMRSAEGRDDPAAYRVAAERGAAALAKMHADVLAVFGAERRKRILEVRAEQEVDDFRSHTGHHWAPHARPGRSAIRQARSGQRQPPLSPHVAQGRAGCWASRASLRVAISRATAPV